MLNRMIERLIDWSLNNRLLVCLALLIIIGAMAWFVPRLNLDAFPDVTNVQVSINTQADGLAAEEVEQLITFPIEAAMYALPDVEQVRSISKTGLSGITVVFKEGTDIYFARQLVFERLQEAQSLIPQGIGSPQMGPNTSGLGQIYQYVLRANDKANVDITQLRSLNDWVVKLLLMPIDGVTDVLSFGGDVRQYQVNINPSRLLAYRLSQQQVMEALTRNNQNAGGWYLNRGQEQLVIRGVGWMRHGEKGLEDIAQTPVTTIEGNVIRVADVASVEFGEQIRQGAVTMSLRDEKGKAEAIGEVVAGVVLKRMGANTKQTIDGINQRVLMINQALPDGVSFEVFYDQSSLIEQAVRTVSVALIQAFVFIVVVLALFLANARAVALVLLSIPLSIGMALSLMAYYGVSANLMSLGGLTVAIGMIVDGAVVVMDNIFKRLSVESSSTEHSLGKHLNGKRLIDKHGDLKQTVALASKEVAKPVFFAAIIVMVVFAPLFTLQGVEGKLFAPMAKSILFAMGSALAIALIVVPALASLLFARGVKVRATPVADKLERGYQLLLQLTMKHQSFVIGFAGLLVVIAVAIVPRLGTEFVPELEEGTLNLRVTLAPTASLETALNVAPKLEALLMEFDEVNYALSRIGRPELGGDPEPVSNIEIYIGLKPVQLWQSADSRVQLQQLMLAKLTDFPGLLFNFSQPIATRVDELLSGVKAQLAIKLFGPDLSVLADKGEQITKLLSEVEGATDVAMEQVAGEAQLVIHPMREQLSRYGLSVNDVMSLVSDGLGGKTAGQIIHGNERYDIYVRLAQNFRNDEESIKALRLQSATGAWVRLADVASVAVEFGAPQIRRDDVQRRVVIQANVVERDMGGVVADIERLIDDKVALPSGYSVSFGGQYENQLRAQQRLMIVVPVSIGLIALLLYFAFGSVSQAFLVLLNLPLALIGSVVALYVSGQYLSVPSAIGFITLFGVAVLNGVVLVEAINLRVKTCGESLTEAAFNGALSRLRPVLMTAITAALGLLPMLLATGVGAEIQRPLATVIVGGLVTSTWLTLLVIPVLYPRFSRHLSR